MAYKRPTTVKLLGDRPKHHTRIPHGLIRDTEVSANGFRVAAFLLSLGDGWKGVSQRDIAAATGMGRDAVGGGIKNLIATGWLVHNQYRNESGHVYKHEYVMNRSHRMAGKPDHTTDEADQGTADPIWSGNPQSYGPETRPSLKEIENEAPVGEPSSGLLGGESATNEWSSGQGIAGSGSAFADREMVDEPMAPGGHVVGVDQGSAVISEANDYGWTAADEAAYRAAVNADDRPGPDLPESEGWLTDAPEEPGLVDLGPW
ncbi:helix-turn-helix domain-containing protein [Mycobacterium sp. MBM]|nr:helix-turn-helix domain-containing protein [Mycobacterium sp. MBM]